MLDIKFIRENKEIVQKAINDKQLAKKVNLEDVLNLDAQYGDLLRRVETHRALRNQLSENISKVAAEDRPKLIAQASAVKEELQVMEKELKSLKIQLNDEMLKLPNILDPEVPYGESDEENIVLRSWGEPTKFSFTPKDHHEIGEELGMIDIETAAKVSGSRFNYLMGDAVFLQFALIQFVMSTLTSPQIIKELCEKVGNPHHTPFTPVLPPVIAKGESVKKMERFDPIDDRYYYEADDVMFTGSAEHTLGPMFMDKSIEEKDLPIRYVGYATSFRREAGTYGKDMRGIFRRHQFDKTEMESWALPEHGAKEHELFVAIQEYFMQQLNIPYQVVLSCSEDTGKPNYRKADIESWMPGQNKYRETHSADYMTDYQARRLNTRYKKRDGEAGYVYMNDATALVMGRTLIAIIENYQQEDGSIKIPEVLKPFMHGKEIISKKS